MSVEYPRYGGRNGLSKESEREANGGAERGTDGESVPRRLVRTKEGELIDPESGLIVEERLLDYGPEWRAFSEGERAARARTGAPITAAVHDRGLTTEIGWANQDASGRNLSPERRRQLSRMRVWHRRLRTSEAGERNLQFALSEIDRMSSTLGVSRTTRETASVVYRRALKDDLVRGRSIEAVASAALYAVIRQEGLPFSLTDVADVSRVGSVEIARAYRHLRTRLNLSLPPSDPRVFLPRFCSELEVERTVERRARWILDAAVAAGLDSGKSPVGIAAAAIYLAGLIQNSKRSQREVAEVAGVTEVTIRHRYHDLLELVAE
ncbi:transcription initiation factor IIB [Halegenticoccus soli]|uniref:transcription initiation factor IIB n=1 Tax=Halegenticoccus soli TaxID=1985678 RepID=UPI000C6CE872|nr:transcription initiation factor IIB 3 [Halegenticoccus soli]